MERTDTPSFSLMQAVKRRFFAMRNGDLAAQMARGGIQYKINFGLNLPQITDIARAALDGTLPDCTHRPDEGERRELARLLWENATTRESRLIAPMLLRHDDLTAATARGMLAGIITTEEADILCHRLLRNFDGAAALAAEVYGSAGATDLQRYAALRLVMNLLGAGKIDLDIAEKLAENESARNCRLTAGICRQIAGEIEFLRE